MDVREGGIYQFSRNSSLSCSTFWRDRGSRLDSHYSLCDFKDLNSKEKLRVWERHLQSHNSLGKMRTVHSSEDWTPASLSFVKDLMYFSQDYAVVRNLCEFHVGFSEYELCCQVESSVLSETIFSIHGKFHMYTWLRLILRLCIPWGPF